MRGPISLRGSDAGPTLTFFSRTASAVRRRDLVRGEETGRDLVEHGPEEVVVVLVNDRDGDWRPCEPARGVEAAEPSADNDDAWDAWEARGRHPLTILM